MSFREWRKGKYSARAVVMDESLAEHDAKYHPDGFDPEKDECKLRESMAKEGAKDDLKSDSNVMSEEDAKYMEAVKNGDMEKAERMVREAAAKAMPDTIKDAYLKPMMFFRGEGLDASYCSGEVLFLTQDENLAKHYAMEYKFKHGDSTRNGKVGKYYVDTSGFLSLIKTKIVDYHFKKDIMPSWDEWKVRQFLFDCGLNDLQIEGLQGRMTDEIVTSKTSDDQTEKEVKEAWDKVISYLKNKGNKGLLGIQNYAIEMVCIVNRNIKSADPVTYDDAGNVIPLSKRFDSKSNDIRF